MANLTLPLQTLYAELLDACAHDAFQTDFPNTEDGNFIAKTLRGKKYWYRQITVNGKRQQKYVGPETPELLEKIKNHKHSRLAMQHRQALVSTLTRSAFFVPPTPDIGNTLSVMAEAGVFRLRGVLVGTVAYQCYPAMLGTHLPSTAQVTSDIDIAQFKTVSVAVDDATPSMLDVLKKANPSFRTVPNLSGENYATNYQAANGLRVDFLTPNQGSDTDKPQHLPALATDAQTLRYLDFLIYDPLPAVALHNTGIYLNVPAPERYAVHKLIVADERPEYHAKKNKDLMQAQTLLLILAQANPQRLKAVWNEAWNRGHKWRGSLSRSLGLLNTKTRDATLQCVGMSRSIIDGLDLKFSTSSARHDFERDIITFLGQASTDTIRCAISREALEDHFDADGLSPEGRLEKFRKNRGIIEAMIRDKYMFQPVEQESLVLLTTHNVAMWRDKQKSK